MMECYHRENVESKEMLFYFCAFLKLGNTKACFCADENHLLEREINDDILKKD